jgi:hypothetical protein
MNSTNTSIQIYARIGGVLYLIIIVVGIFSELFVRDKLIVSGDPSATAHNIMASEMLWRISIAGGIAMLACAVVLALILFVILRPVNQNLALLAVFFNLISISVEAIIKLNLIDALFLLVNTNFQQEWQASELYAQVYRLVILHSSGYNISLVFFGLNCFFWGYLIFKSGFFPKILGVLLIICCVCYVVNSFAWFLDPIFAGIIFPYILVPCFIAELSMCLWLIIKGVSTSKWMEQMKKIQEI